MSSKNRLFHPLLLAMISLGAASTFAAAPTITVFSPTSGALNAAVTITGTNFVAPVSVSFDGVASASVTVVSTTSVKAIVPVTASTGTIAVTTSGGSATSSSAFTVLPGMAATPTTVGPPTTALTLYYSGYGAREAVDLYFDEEDFALGTTSANGAGNLPVTIPADAHPGSHWITAVGRHSAYAVQIPFTVRASWPQFGFQPNHKAKNHYENVLSAGNVINLDIAWQTPYIGGVNSTPAIVGGIAYLGFTDGTVRAFNEITGAQQWSYTTGADASYSSPAISNGIVYFGSYDGYLYALNAATGALKWRYATGGAVWSSPNVVNGIVYFGSFDHKVYALNATTGALIWSYATNGVVQSSPMISNGILYVGSDDYSVYALNAATGALIWSYPTTNNVFASPVIAEGLVCFGSTSGTTYALNASTGALAWSYPAGGASSAAVLGGALFFSAGDGDVYSLSAGGDYRWSITLPDGAGSELGGVLSPLCVANGVVYVADEDDTYALDPDNGDILTTLPVGSGYGGPAVVDGALFAGDVASGSLNRYTLDALQSNYVAPRPDPMQLRPHPLR